MCGDILRIYLNLNHEIWYYNIAALSRQDSKRQPSDYKSEILWPLYHPQALYFYWSLPFFKEMLLNITKEKNTRF